jgi:hypothetical protein
MRNQILPRQADNAFQGQKVALWIFTIVLLILGAMSINSIFIGRFVATNADGLPLDTYTPAGAQAVVSSYAIWGLTQLIIVTIGFVVLVRYRTLTSLMFLLLLLEQVLLRVIHHYSPVAKATAAPGSYFITGLITAMAVGLVLSLWRRNAPT